MLEKIKEKSYIIVLAAIIIYLTALGLKTGSLVYTEYYKDRFQIQRSEQ